MDRVCESGPAFWPATPAAPREQLDFPCQRSCTISRAAVWLREPPGVERQATRQHL